VHFDGVGYRDDIVDCLVDSVIDSVVCRLVDNVIDCFLDNIMDGLHPVGAPNMVNWRNGRRAVDSRRRLVFGFRFRWWRLGI
jgi:hypothetical protein